MADALGSAISAIVTLIIIRTGLLTKTADTLSKRAFVSVYSVFQRSIWWSLSCLNALVDFSGWWRETEYGRTSQPLMDFLGQAAGAGHLRAAVRYFPGGDLCVHPESQKLWWLWGGAFSGLFVAF
ncbi:MAG: hypothetical protein CM15mP103_09230 [Gammaproteobacteria bacterium]|nr:MAG: hypothetical protein CM15mP103_09230 [Gammaproteobacteria bacterium]